MQTSHRHLLVSIAQLVSAANSRPPTDDPFDELRASRRPLLEQKGFCLLSTIDLVHRVQIPPEASPARPASAVVMVHGWKGDETVMWIFKQTIPPGVAIITPRAPLAVDDGGYGWFQRAASELEPEPDSLWAGRDHLHRFLAHLPQRYPVDPAGMVLMGMGDEHLGDSIAVLLGRLHDTPDVPGWIDHCRLPRCQIANEIDVVLHRPTFHLLQVECVCHRHALPLHTGNGILKVSLCVTHYTVFSVLCLPGRMTSAISRGPSKGRVGSAVASEVILCS